MYQQQNRRRPSFRGRRGGGARFSNRRPVSRFSGRGESIDISRFINKAVQGEVEVVIAPEHSFADFPVQEALKRNILGRGYVTPTPIQDKAIPHALRGADIVGIAHTGTGKTGAFLIPLIDKVLRNPREKILVAVPTRELALQINQELMSLTRGMRVFSTCAIGGSNLGKQVANLRRENHFVIGTPGRLKDLIERRVLDLSGFKTIVLDEADRMLDMGFINDMRFMMEKMPKERQTLFFSATMSREIEKLIKDFLRNPVSISIKTKDTPSSIHQDIVRIKQGGSKIETLHDLLIQEEFRKVLIFGRTKHGVERLSAVLSERGFKAESIHGNKNLSGRQRALARFKGNQVQILVATDVAARGLDIDEVSHVINFDLPASYADYVHRIGRTGRGNKKGKALTFVD